MSETALAQQSQRLVSLDAFRGATIALMVLVNNPGSWGQLYWPVAHANWDGWTPTDFVFPFFLFIVGVAMTFSFDKRLAAGQSRLRLFEQVVRRTIILAMLGLILSGFPNFRLIGPFLLTIAGLSFLFADEPILSMGDSGSKMRRNKIVAWSILGAALVWFVGDFGHFNGPVKISKFGMHEVTRTLEDGTKTTESYWAMFPLTNDMNGGTQRIPGVLARIAACYFFASIIMMFAGLRGRIAWLIGLIVGYWAIMRFIPAPSDFVIGAAERSVRDAPPDAPYPGALNDWLDMKLLGAHLYRHRPDPEGLLSTLPSIATVLCGVLTGQWLHTDRSRPKLALGMFLAGLVGLLVGWAMSFEFPINKKIWSSSYVVFMAGWCLIFLSMSYWIIDVKGWKKPVAPLLVFGSNAILIFFASGMMARLFGMIKWTGEYEGAEKLWNVKSYLYTNFFTQWFEAPKTASIAYAIFYVLLWLALTYPLYRKKIFLKV